jgi:putative heme-binding domain-containing protein
MDVPKLGRRDAFALKFSGTLKVDNPGRYRFFVASDDGSRIYLDNELLVNNDGLHGMSEKSGRVRLTAGSHPFVVTYFDNGGGDGLRVAWAGPGFRKQPIPASRLSVSGSETLHDVAIRVLAAIPGVEAKAFSDLGNLIKAGKFRQSAVAAMLSIPRDQWPQDAPDQRLLPVAESLAAHVAEIPARYRTSPAALQEMELTDRLAAMLSDEQARMFRSRLADLRINVIRIGTVPQRMIYDKETITIEAGKPVEFVFTNTDEMPHNFAIVRPGSLEEVGLLAEATARDADAIERHYIPKSDQIMLASRLLQPGETQALSFEAPTTPGIYPFVCTYPGHWRRMYGALYVVADIKEYASNPVDYLARNPLTLRDELLKYTARNTEWTYADLASSLSELHDGRSFDVGKTIFRAANCVACHRLNGEGYEFGPDLAKLDAKKVQPEHILRSMLEPSTEIDEKFQQNTLLTEAGILITGLVLEENDDVIKIIVDPIARPEPISVNKDEVEERSKSKVSSMPEGVLSKLLREEILDLIAYIHAGGDMKHKIYEVGHEHKH